MLGVCQAMLQAFQTTSGKQAHSACRQGFAEQPVCVQETEMMKAGLADKQKQQKSHEQHSVRMLAANLDLAAR